MTQRRGQGDGALRHGLRPQSFFIWSERGVGHCTQSGNSDPCRSTLGAHTTSGLAVVLASHPSGADCVCQALGPHKSYREGVDVSTTARADVCMVGSALPAVRLPGVGRPALAAFAMGSWTGGPP